MPNKEENIDRFVKKVVTHYDVQYDENHWDLLEKQLDKEMPFAATPSSTGVSTIVISVISGMVIMLGILWFSGAIDPKGNEVQYQDQAVIDQHDSDSDGTVALNEPIKTEQPAEISATNQRTTPTPTVSTNDEGEQNEINPFYDQHSNSQSAINGSDLRMEQNSYHIEQKSFNNPIQEKTCSLIENAPYASVPDDFNGQTIPEEEKGLVQLGVALSGAPDFNGVGIQSNKEASWQLGMQLFATYKERISLSTGVLYNKKQYTTPGEDYFPPTGYWNRYTNGVIPDEVFGYCAVLDIPINLTYNWNPQKRIQFLSSVGVSNYFILGEDYHYRFFNGNPGAAEGWDTEEMTKQMFGVGNVSVGILWYIKPRIGIKLEPYLKIPLKEIGWGRVELYSTGTLLSIQYIFNKN